MTTTEHRSGLNSAFAVPVTSHKNTISARHATVVDNAGLAWSCCDQSPYTALPTDLVDDYRWQLDIAATELFGPVLATTWEARGYRVTFGTRAEAEDFPLPDALYHAVWNDAASPAVPRPDRPPRRPGRHPPHLLLTTGAPMTTTTVNVNATERLRATLGKLSFGFLRHVAGRDRFMADAARWELARRAHEATRDRLLRPSFSNPVAAITLRSGDVLSERHGVMRLLVREVYTLPNSGRVLIAGSYLSLVTGEPESRWREMPLLAYDDTSLNLVTHDLSDVAPYAADLPETAVAR